MLRPLRDHIVVKPQERQASAVILTVLDEKPNIGTVVAVGPNVDPMDVVVGQTVRFGEFQHPEFWDQETFIKYLIIRDKDVAGVVEDGKAH